MIVVVLVVVLVLVSADVDDRNPALHAKLDILVSWHFPLSIYSPAPLPRPAVLPQAKADHLNIAISRQPSQI